jgi:glycine/D-amino acid oxidase-like deaminating enzyme
MKFSYWENKTWLSNIDFVVVGSGIVGLNCALELRAKQPKSKIVILEKGLIPHGASTRNAGFACFGSLTEILNDFDSHSPLEVYELIQKRVSGLKRLRNLLGDKQIKYRQFGGNEIFLQHDTEKLHNSLAKIDDVNKLLEPLFKEKVFVIKKNKFNFQKTLENTIFNKFEGQIDTGEMMDALLNKAYRSNIRIINNVSLESYEDIGSCVNVCTNQFALSCNKLFIATNGFSDLIINEKVAPARAQVLITKPIKNLKVIGTFHFQEGYYYFRNIDDRILLGGGRNLDFQAEKTNEFGVTETIQSKLDELLKDVILPNTKFEVDQRWSGIMGVGNKKTTVTKQLSENVNCGVRLGGMGIAIGTSVGKDLANLI